MGQDIIVALIVGGCLIAAIITAYRRYAGRRSGKNCGDCHGCEGQSGKRAKKNNGGGCGCS